MLGIADGTGPLIRYTVPAAAVDTGVDQPCYEKHFRIVDIMWQLKHADETQDAENLRALNACLVENGEQPGADLDHAVGLMGDAHLSEQECGLWPGQLEGKASPPPPH